MSKKIWAATVKNGVMNVKFAVRLPRKSKKFVKGILELVGTDYVLMSTDMYQEYEDILTQLKEFDGKTDEIVRS